MFHLLLGGSFVSTNHRIPPHASAVLGATQHRRPRSSRVCASLPRTSLQVWWQRHAEQLHPGAEYYECRPTWGGNCPTHVTDNSIRINPPITPPSVDITPPRVDCSRYTPVAKHRSWVVAVQYWGRNYSAPLLAVKPPLSGHVGLHHYTILHATTINPGRSGWGGPPSTRRRRVGRPAVDPHRPNRSASDPWRAGSGSGRTVRVNGESAVIQYRGRNYPPHLIRTVQPDPRPLRGGSEADRGGRCGSTTGRP